MMVILCSRKHLAISGSISDDYDWSGVSYWYLVGRGLGECQTLHTVQDRNRSKMCFPGGAMVKNPPANAGNARDMGLIPG